MPKSKRHSQQKQLNTFEPVNLTLTSRGREILGLLGAGNPPSRVADAIGVSRPAITYWIKKLKKHGYIKLQTRDVYKIFTLTYLGSKIVTGSEEVRRVIVLEDYPIKYGVIEGEKAPVRWEKLGQPRNWTKLGFKIGKIRVVKTSRSIIVHPGQLRGFDPYRLVYVAGRECSRVASWLQNHLGMVLGPGEPIKRPTFQVYDPVAEELTKYYSFKDDLGGADRSPPSKRGHWEMGPEVAKDYLMSFARLHQIQNRLTQLENMQERQTKIMETFAESMQDHRAMINEIRELVEELRRTREGEK